MQILLAMQIGQPCTSFDVVFSVSSHTLLSLNNLIATTIKFPTWTGDDGVMIEGTATPSTFTVHGADSCGYISCNRISQ